MIRLETVSKKFDPRGIAGVHDFTLAIMPGEILGLLGPNGSGKTTLLKIIAGNIHPDKGQVKTEDKAHFFEQPENAKGNVQEFLISQISQAIPVDKKLQLARDMADVFEFTFQLKQNLDQVSAGQRQKILLAASLINQDQVVLMDEPFRHLDPFTRREILKDLFKYIRQKQMTVVWVTHELNEAMLFCDRLALINCGRLEQLGSVEEFCFQPRNLFVAQFLGYKNFLPIKKINGLWETPWGNFQNNFAENEAYLVIPSNAWKISSGMNKLKIIEKNVQDLAWEFEFELDGRKFFIRSNSRGEENWEPILSECFLIPL